MKHITITGVIVKSSSKKELFNYEEYITIKLTEPFWQVLFLQGTKVKIKIEKQTIQQLH